MKLILLILSLLLSLLTGGKGERSAVSSGTERQYCREDASSNPSSRDYARERACCITAVQGYTFTGSENANSASLRTVQTGRRSSPQAKSSFRFVKSGKIIDNKNLHPCLVLSYQLMTGLVFSQRYLHIICRLRI